MTTPRRPRASDPPIPSGPAISRREMVTLLAAGAVASACRRPTPAGPPRPTPSAAQLAWQRDEIAIFVHYGVNTYTDREWGDGRESPAIFAPDALDPARWAAAARRAGARAMILTAKHHDGFCLWPSRVTGHTVAASPWRGGQGDLVREFVDACRREELRPGLYLSPWDRNAESYGDSPRYNDFYVAQLTELLTGYGPLAELWFDGANGEGPNGRRQEYDWPRFFATVRRYQPDAVIFSDAGPDVRWIGNEQGETADPNWSTVDPSVVPYPGAWSDEISAALTHGDPHGSVWRPAETNTSIRPGWFYHPAEDDGVKSLSELEQVYLSSVGRNSKLLLNVPPAPSGAFHPNDVARLEELGSRIANRFARDHAAGARVDWRRTGSRTAVASLALETDVRAGLLRLEEDITGGQDVARYSVWAAAGGPLERIAEGQTIGYRKLDVFPPRNLRRLEIRIEDAVGPPRPISIGLYAE